MSVDLGTYGGLQHGEGYEGGIVDMNVYHSESKSNYGPTVIAAGRAVARAGLGVKSPVTDDDVLVGFAGRLIAGHALVAGLPFGYAPNESVFVVDDGFMFAVPVENVTAGDRVVAITGTGGQFGSAQNATGGAPAEATGTVTFTAAGTAGDTVTINGVAFTAIAAGGAAPTPTQFVLGATAAQSAANLLAQLNANNNASLTVLGFTVNGATITATANNAGTAGNAYTLAKNSTAVTVSGATLTGGAAATTGLGTGRILFGTSTWESTTQAGQLAKMRVRVSGIAIGQ